MMQQASVCDGLSFDPFTSHEDRVALPEVDIRRAKVADALVVASAMALGHDKAATSASRKKIPDFKRTLNGGENPAIVAGQNQASLVVGVELSM
jgi:hypothetical protein